MHDDHLWAAVKITEAAVTQLFNGASTPNEVRRGQEIGEIVAELYIAIYAGIVEADYRVGKINIVESSDEATQPETFGQPMEPVAAAPAMAPNFVTQQLEAVAAAPEMTPDTLIQPMSPVAAAPEMTPDTFIQPISPVAAAQDMTPDTFILPISPVAAAQELTPDTFILPISPVAAAPDMTPDTFIQPINPVAAAQELTPEIAPPSRIFEAESPDPEPSEILPEMPRARIVPAAAPAGDMEESDPVQEPVTPPVTMGDILGRIGSARSNGSRLFDR